MWLAYTFNRFHFRVMIYVDTYVEQYALMPGSLGNNQCHRTLSRLLLNATCNHVLLLSTSYTYPH